MNDKGRVVRDAVDEAEDLSQVEADTTVLAEAREKAALARHEKALDAEAKLNICAGRIQASKVVTTFAELLTVSELRRIKGLGKEAGKTWKEVCERVGISTQMADQYLRLGETLGDSFIADMSAIGLSIRTLETARKLPEDVRKRLTSGEVIDLEEVGKEELTTLIKDLAQEHAAQLQDKDATITKETKAKEAAQKKAKDHEAALENVLVEIKDLKQGLPADDKEAVAMVRKAEREILPYLVMVMNTKVDGRGKAAVGRLMISLDLLKAMAGYASDVLGARDEAARGLGEGPDREALSEKVQELAEEIEAYDGKAPPTGPLG